MTLQEENKKLRRLLLQLRALLANSSYRISGTAAFLHSIDAALSQQDEPVCDWCAGAGHDFYGDKCIYCKSEPAPAQDEQSGLVEALVAFVSLAEDRLHELGALSPEMFECLANGRTALSTQEK